MLTQGPEDAFRLARLRLVRLPPQWIAVPGGGKKPVVVPIELAVGVTDDYGTDIDMFDSLDLTIEVLDADTLAPPSGVSLRLEVSSPSSSSPPPSSANFTFTPSRGPFHNLKLSLGLSPTSATRPPPKRLSFRLSVAPSPSSSTSSGSASTSKATQTMRRFVGETGQEALETWDEKRYVFLSVTSGPVEVKMEGKEVKVAGSKGAIQSSAVSSYHRSRLGCSPAPVQTALRQVHVSPPSASSSSDPPSAPSASASPPITIVERPGLNNSTGQRLWDCAIGLSAFFCLHPNALDASLPLSSTLPSLSSSSPAIDTDAPASKRPRLDSPDGRPKKRRRIKIVDLGAGCALATMAVRRLLDNEGADVLATDVEATVETTLRENLVANGEEEGVRAEVLDWGELDPARVESLARCEGGQVDSLTLIGSDILYNPSSHSLLLSTLLSFLRPSPSSSPPPPPTRALIAYKRRTDGDDAFFSLAAAAGLEVKKVWEWGEVGVWSFE
ncbi:hypothetical protein JCM6882_006536 [Rhodosporidiobolus microsporus]